MSAVTEPPAVRQRLAAADPGRAAQPRLGAAVGALGCSAGGWLEPLAFE
jgi:hypothetical protein